MKDQFEVGSLDEFVGQTKLKERLLIHIGSAIERGEPLDHILFISPPGCGKSTLARLIADVTCESFDSYMMPIKPAVIRRAIQSGSGVILFDEIHRLPPRQQENLLPVIQDGYLQLDNGVRIDVEGSTFICATTEPDKLIAPLIDRFPIRPTFEDYTDEELSQIIRLMADKAGVTFTDEEAEALGRATGGVPRNARSVIIMSRDLGSTDPREILPRIGLTPDGLSDMHVMYLKVLQDCGHQAGLEIIGAHLRYPKSSIIDLERLLLRRKFIEYSPQGRVLTVNGSKAIKELTS